MAEPARPVYLMHYAVPERDGVRSLVPHQWLTVSQPDEAHHAHYCRFEVAEPELVYARPVHTAAHTEEEARVQHETRRAAGPHARQAARGVLARWLVAVGEKVAVGQVLGEERRSVITAPGGGARDDARRRHRAARLL